MPPPPAPPPPPPLLPSSSILSSGGRTSTNSYRKADSPLPASAKSPAPGLDAQTLQYAAAGLRKTQHSEPFRSDFENLSDGRLDGTNVQLHRRYRQDRPLYEPLESNQTRETLHASSFDPRNVVQIGDVHRHPLPLNYYSTERPAQSYSSTYTSQSQYSNSSYQQQGNGSVRDGGYTVGNGGLRDSGGYITDPRAHIRAYATQTPAYTVMDDRRDTGRGYESNRGYDSSSRQVVSSDPGKKFAKELRDQGLTRTQRIANQFQQSQVRDIPPPNSLDSVYQRTPRNGVGGGGDQIDSLIRDMEWRMKTGVGAAGENNCCKCGEGISNDRPGCTALDQMFHVACFTCKECNKPLAGSSFYNVDGKPLCEQDYKNTLDRCAHCGEIIMDKLLRASGSTFHPSCFMCSVCKKCLDGVPFTVDANNKVHCVTCFHQKYAPRCAVCSQPIVPDEGEKESVRVVAMDKSFHVQCYRCEDCNMQLSSKIEGQGCYPLDQHLYCKGCNGKRLVAIAREQTQQAQ